MARDVIDDVLDKVLRISSQEMSASGRRAPILAKGGVPEPEPTAPPEEPPVQPSPPQVVPYDFTQHYMEIVKPPFEIEEQPPSDLDKFLSMFGLGKEGQKVQARLGKGIEEVGKGYETFTEKMRETPAFKKIAEVTEPLKPVGEILTSEPALQATMLIPPLMGFAAGGKFAKELWNAMKIAERNALAKQAGLEGKVGSKAFEKLSAEEKTALGKVAPKVEGVKPIPPAEAVKPPAIEAPLVKEGAGVVPPVKPPEVPPAVGVTPPSKLPASQKILDRIAFKEEPQGFIDKVKQGWDRFDTAMLDDLAPINKFVEVAKKGGMEVSLEENPYIAARLLRGIASKANIMINEGTFGRKFWKMVKGKAVPDFTGEGLKKILKPVHKPDTWQDFSAYLVAKRSVSLADKGIVTGITREDGLKAISELENKYKDFPKIAEGVYKYQNNLLDYIYQSGLIDKDLLAKLLQNQTYVPFYRVFDELQARGFMGKKMVDIAKPIKRMKGSERDIINPLESIVKNTHAFVNASDRNMVGVMAANLVKKNPELVSLFEKVKTPISRVAQVTAKELGISVEGLSKEQVEKVVDIFRPSLFTKDNVVSVLIDGKKQYFKVDPELYRGLQAMTQESMGIISKALGYPARWLRAGATLSPDFALRNPARDQMTAFVYSKYGFLPGYDFLKGVASIIGKDKDYLLYKMSGAEHSMLVSFDRQYLQTTFKDIVEGKGFADYVKHPLELLQISSELGEKATRLGEFKLGIGKGVSPLTAGMASREVTLDFGKIGTTAKAVNQLIAFFNANIRGWDRMVQAFKEAPVPTTLKIVAGITAPSVALYAVNRNDPRWDEIPQWQKDLFWLVMTPDHIYRIPKPFELGILFGSIPERALEYLTKGDTSLLTEALRNAVEAGLPGFLPTAMQPVIENLTNFSFFKSRPIVSPSKEGLPPALQYTPFTSEVAKKIGDLANYPPAKIDNLIYGYTGGLGRYATDILDGILKKTGISPSITEPSPDLADRPVIKAFIVRNPYGSASASVDKFYNKLQEYQSAENYLKAMLKESNQTKFEQYRAQHPEVLFTFDFSRNDYFSATARLFRQVSSEISEIRKKQTEVYNSTDMTSDQKRTVIDRMDRLISELAQRGLEIANNPASLIEKQAEMQVKSLPKYMEDYFKTRDPTKIQGMMEPLITAKNKAIPIIANYERRIENLSEVEKPLANLIRHENPETDALLNIWGRSQAVHSIEALNLVKQKADELGIPYEAVPVLTKDIPGQGKQIKPPTEQEIWDNTLSVFPAYYRDYLWDAGKKWDTPDLQKQYVQVNQEKNKDKEMLYKYDRLSPNEKERYRAQNPDVDVALNIWGRVNTVKSAAALAMLRERAKELGIPFEALPISSEYKRRKAQWKATEARTVGPVTPVTPSQTPSKTLPIIDFTEDLKKYGLR